MFDVNSFPFVPDEVGGFKWEVMLCYEGNPFGRRGDFFNGIQSAFSRLDADGQAALRHDLEQLWSQHNQATDGTLYLELELLEVQAVRRS